MDVSDYLILRFLRAGIICNPRRIIGPGGAATPETPFAPPHNLLSRKITTTLSSIITLDTLPHQSIIQSLRLSLECSFQDITSLNLSVPTCFIPLKSAGCSRLCCKRIQLTLPPSHRISSLSRPPTKTSQWQAKVIIIRVLNTLSKGAWSRCPLQYPRGIYMQTAPMGKSPWDASKEYLD